MPVVVTDKAGHYFTGLRVPDFHIAENGVPQDVISLSTSTSPNELVSVQNGHAPAAGKATNTPNTGTATASPKRTYLICIDTLHSSFSNFKNVRQALEKFFDKEQAGDSQYALIALGRQIKVIRTRRATPQTVDSNRMTVARENTDALSELARETGGLFFENNNDLLKGIQRAFADGREYYILAYVPKNKSEDGTFRHIAVEVNNKK